MMKYKVVILIIAFFFSNELLASFISYTNRADFNTLKHHDYEWSFDEFLPATQPTNVFAPDGTTRLTLANANPIPSSFFPTVTTLDGMGIYFNPQAERAFEFSTPINTFGISLVWGSIYNPEGVSVIAFDNDGLLVGQVTIFPIDALSEPFPTSGGDTYEGFLGFQSSTPIYSIRFSQLDGSVWYDNALWSYSALSEPSILFLFVFGCIGIVLSRQQHVK